MFCAAAGLHSDAEVLINHARQVAQRHKITNGNEIGCEQLVRSICDLKQGYTQHGGLRPFGVSFLYAGWDKVGGFQLYQSDASGGYLPWLATCIGRGSFVGMNSLETLHEGVKDLRSACALAVKALASTFSVDFSSGDSMLSFPHSIFS